MEFFQPKNLKIDWVKYFKPAMLASIALTALSVVLMVKPGLNYGIDFRGGLEALVSFQDPNVDVGELRETLDNKIENLSVVNFASTNGKTEFQITGRSESPEKMSTVLTESLVAKYGPRGEKWEATKIDTVGPKAGSELRKSALLSMIYTCLLVGLYMYWRFDARYAPGVLACIFHDLIVATGFLVVSGMEFSTTVVAGLLTLAGYSVNDTVVIYDRIRELENGSYGKSKAALVNEAINSTLSRTVLTSVTTLGACVILFFIGAADIKAFAATLFVGIIVGTYSSVFVAAPIYLWANNRLESNATGTNKLATSTKS